MEIHDSNLIAEDGGVIQAYVIREEHEEAGEFVTRIWLDDENIFRTAELPVLYLDFRVEANTNVGYGPEQIVRWNGTLVHAVDGSTDALWARSTEFDERQQSVGRAFEVWLEYRKEDDGFRDRMPFVAYAWGDDLGDDE